MSAELNSPTQQRSVRIRQRLRALTRFLLTSALALMAFLTLERCGASPAASLIVAFLMYAILEMSPILDDDVEVRWQDDLLFWFALAALSIPSVALGVAAAVASLHIIRDWPLFEFFFMGMSAAVIAYSVGFWITAHVFAWLSSRRALPV
jgi:hypothetical protein